MWLKLLFAEESFSRVVMSIQPKWGIEVFEKSTFLEKSIKV